MSDYVHGDKIGRDKYVQNGPHSTFTVIHRQDISQQELADAVSELNAFVTRLRQQGVVAPDGSISNPGAVVAAVEREPGNLQAVARAIAGGAKNAVLSMVKDGVAALVIGLLGAVA
jgi:hypothetical protein